MADEMTIFQWLGSLGVGSAVIAFCGYIVRQINILFGRINTHELNDANTYAKEVNIQASLGRVHDKIEGGLKDMRKDMNEGFRDVQEDIKKILQDGNNHK